MGNEDEYFAREEAEKLHRLHQKKAQAQTQEARESRKAAHFMKCPKCGYDLQTLKWREVEIEKCFDCGVIVLDDGELEQLAGQEGDGSLVRGLFDLFRFDKSVD